MTTGTDLWSVTAIVGLAGLSVLTRSLFYLSSKPWALPRWAQRGLQYAPVAAMAAVIAPELLMAQGELISSWKNARLFGAAAGAVWFFCNRSSRQAVLGTIAAGMAVYLPLHIGLGW
jgi:branched-subunit amino acid transport protein